MDKYNVQNDRYCYPSSSVLVNKLGITDEAAFEEAERDITGLAIDSVHYIEPPYSLETFQYLHIILFKELYAWAGEIRTVDISKGGTRFCTVDFIVPQVEKIFSRLEQEQYLTIYTGFDLVKKFAEYYGDLNMVHPFREGNGRVQRLFFEQLAFYNGYRLDWRAVKSQEDWIQANIDSVYVENARLEAIFGDALQRL